MEMKEIKSNLISIENLDKAEVLAALYNAAIPVGLGIFHYDPKPMTQESAKEFLKAQIYFDYINGRAMKIDLSGNDFDPTSYDENNGEGTAAFVVSILRETHSVQDRRIIEKHIDGMIKITLAEQIFPKDKVEKKKAQLKMLADGDTEALSICFKFVTFYKLVIDPKGNTKWKDFFDGFNPKLGAQEWYSKKDPLDMLEKGEIKGREIVELLKENDGDMESIYISLALLPSSLDKNSYRALFGLRKI
ncbi:MAG: hypothetical protein ACP5RT_01735 [Candidatus Micrarchaeia archaeon]